MSNGWKAYEPFDAFQIAVSMFVESGAEKDIFVVGRRQNHFKKEMEFFGRLKKAGLVS